MLVVMLCNKDDSMIGLTKNNSETIGFVISCLFSTAIDINEFHQWCLKIIKEGDADDVPAYLFDLLEFNGVLANVFQVIGFVPHWDHNEDEALSLYGIAYKRGMERYEWPVSRSEAIKKLKRNPQIEEKFQEIFPFIDYR